MRRDALAEYRKLLSSAYGGHPPRLGVGPRASAERLAWSRSFDDGAPVAVAGRREDAPWIEYELGASASERPFIEYDLGLEHAPGDEWQEYQLSAGHAAAEEFVEYDLGPRAAEEVVRSASKPERPCACEPAPVEAPPAPVAKPAPVESASSSSASAFTRRQIESLVRDNELLADIQSILGGKEPQAEASPPRAPAPAATPPAPRHDPPPPPAPASSEHAIFDRIAENMRYAMAYDLGSVELAKRFDAFDRQSSTPTLRTARAPRESGGVIDVAPLDRFDSFDRQDR
ncbi:hypothetical protein [Sandaracinus amylolyticus]|uniref:hypothetical protein n=1 Tax=Sandaracinus amylolyticus TaxID=927083 RepID=UPI001F23C455|nr:hypothetical protein [Sandaracinus amylolyticus]UJR82739.1 Hypothetical protein I5071_48040 [Sandaracinus amylolyticus]